MAEPLTLWRELRRRRVLRTAGLYIVGAWVAIQVAGIFFPAWAIPETALRFFIVAAVVCFPLVLVFGWRYDITSKGLIRTPPLQAGDTFDVRLRRADFLILAALAAIALTVLYDSAGRIQGEIAGHREALTVLPNSIAVLPFDNLDAEQETSFFSDGVTEEILHRLSTLGSLHVIGRTSSFAFRGAEDGPARVAELIGVRYLLHGSVRRDENQVRVTARLTDANGFQVWSQSYDRRLEGIFAIQSEIASQVSSKVLNEIVPLNELPAGRTTQDMDAYNDYLVGLAFVNGRPPGWQQKAEAAFRRAIALDASFALPHAGLAIALFINRGPALNDEAQRAAERALELDPDLAEAHAALGLITTELDIDHERGIRHLQRAIELDPSFVHSYNWLAIAYDKLGREEEMLAAQQRGLAIDPLNPPLVSNVASQLIFDGDADGARRLLERLMLLPEPPGVALWDLHELENAFGRFDDAAMVSIQTVRAYAETRNPQAFASLASAYERLGLSEWAEYWMSVYEEQEPDDFVRAIRKSYWLRQRGDYDAMLARMKTSIMPPEAAWPQLPRFVAAVLAMSHIGGGEYDTAIRIIEAGPPPTYELFTREMNSTDAMDFLHGLAYAYRKTGRDEKADAVLDDIRSHLSSERAQGLHYPPLVFRLAENAALRGATDEAIESLRHAIDLGFNDYYWMITSDLWGATANHPEFLALLSDIKARVDRQRARIESQHDEQAFRQEIQRLIEK
jgi:TolB-like protein/Tfp pilus assembly protein PilF